MLRFSPVLHTLSAALVFSVVSPVSGKELPKVVFQCDSEQHPLICTALIEALRNQSPGLDLKIAESNAPTDTEMTKQSSGLSLRYIEQRRTEASFSGQLVWQDQDEQPVEGPVLEFSIMDSTVQGKSLAPFAQALIEVSDLPI